MNIPTQKSLLERKRHQNQAFSLVEMLVVIAVIAIIAAIGLPMIGDVSNSASTGKSKRNAQSLASMFAAAQTAGVDFFATGDLDQTILNVVNGGTPTAGAFAGDFFGVPNMELGEQTDASTYLELSNGMLMYNSGG